MPLRRKYSTLLLIVFVHFLALIPLLSQNGKPYLKFDHVSVNEGISSRLVSCMYQDRDGFIWIGTSNGLNRYDGYEMKVFKSDPDDSLSIPPSKVMDLLEDQNGRLLVGTQYGLRCFNKQLGLFEKLNFETTNVLDSAIILRLFKDSKDYIWISTWNNGLFRVSPKYDSLMNFSRSAKSDDQVDFSRGTPVLEDSNENLWVTSENYEVFKYNRTNGFQKFELKGTRNVIAGMIEDSKGNIWFAFYNTKNKVLSKWNPHTKEFQNFNYGENTHDITSKLSLTIAQFNPNSIWIGTQDKGLFFLDSKAQKFNHYKYNEWDTNSLSGNTIRFIQQDNEKNIWIGTDYSGLSRINAGAKNIITYQHNPNDSNSLSHNKISCVFEDSNGYLWIGTKGGGLNKIDRTNNEVIRYVHDPLDKNSICGNYVTGIAQDIDGNIWVGTDNHGGLSKLNPRTNSFTNFKHNPSDSSSIDINWIYQVFKDDNNNIWIVTAGRRGLYKVSDEKIEPYDTIWPHLPTIFFKSDNGSIWGRYENFVYKFNAISKEYDKYEFPNFITSIYKVRKFKHDFLLLVTSNGLIKWNPYTNESKQLVKQQKGNNIIFYDGDCTIWNGMIRGLFRYNICNDKVDKYDLNDGFLSSVFNSEAIFKSPNTGELILGTDKGVVIFHPDSLKPSTFIPPIAVTYLSYYDEKESEGKPIEVENITYLDEVSFPHHQNTFSVKFAALSYSKTPRNQYAYQLNSNSSITDNWIQLGTQRNITLPNLSPGSYFLRVKGSNGDGVWNEEGTMLKITIHPPWWWSWPAKSIYGLVLLSLLYGIYQYTIRQKLQAAEANRIKEIDALKTRLYTNITHEFRTPLTVILGMIDKVKQDPRNWFSEGTQLVKTNAQRLLHLVNQLLDLAKMESGAMKLNYIQGDIIPYSAYIVQSFQSYAASKSIQLHFLSEEESIIMDYVPDKFLQILSNLISNAIKYTPENGHIYVQVEESIFNNSASLVINVKDTGVGIPEEKLPFIFDRFYQADNSSVRQVDGTGIGLALTKELVKLHGGEIQATSIVNRGSTFTVVLPIVKKAITEATITEASVDDMIIGFIPGFKSEVAEVGDAIADKALSKILIIEDNIDVITYLQACLPNNYEIITAEDGQEGIDKAFGLIPDIIISDVMMPKKDGYEVCNTLKQDERTSHIPIILLTAKADTDSRIEGLEYGADVYLAKPFNEKELLVRIEQLIALRVELQQRYRLNKSSLTKNRTQYPSKEDLFINKVSTAILENISDENWKVTDLAHAVGLSREQLHRKLKALTDLSASHFINAIRLTRAKELLETSDLNISEVAYQVGFKDPARFSNLFKNEFGITPSATRK